jgi:hypothetical protein
MYRVCVYQVWYHGAVYTLLLLLLDYYYNLCREEIIRGAGQRPFFSCLENQKGADLKYVIS